MSTSPSTCPTAAPPSRCEAKIIVDVAESGGRTVERVTTLPVRAKGAMIGVKKDFDDSLGQGDVATFEAIAVAPDGTRTARKAVSWSLYQINEDYQWFNTDGRWSYEPVKSSKRLAAGSIDIDPQAPAKFSAPVAWGRHRLDLKSADGEETSISFDVGWSGTAGPDTPDNVVVTLDKASYAPGDQAKLRVASHFAGKATIALVGDKLEKFIDVDLVEGDNVVPFDVGADWGPGAYAVALTHRPLDVKAKRMPGRALGLAWFSIDEAAHKLDVAIHAPDKTRPREPLTVPIQIGGLAPGEEAEIAVAAVDVGILNLTGYKTPDPRSYFFGQRKLAVDIRDLYGMLIDGMQGAAGALQTGGDSSGSLEGNLPTQPPLALFSGVVKVGADGAARIAFDLPAFNGSVRVMAVAWSKSKVGSAESDVIVRDPVVVTATLPRFLDLGDRSQVHVDFDNVEGEAGDYRLDLDIHGPLTADADALSRTVKLAAHQRASLAVPISAAGVGAATVDLKLTGPGLSLTQRFPLGVSAGAPDVYRRVIKPLAAGESATIADDLVADFVPGTGSVSIAASPFGALDTPALLQALDRYPYGCSEQVVSRAMPLLYRQPDRRARASRRRRRRRRARQAGDRPRNDAAELQRRVRPVDGRRRQRRPLARRLRRRLPHPRAREVFRRAASRLRPRARPSAQFGDQRRRPRRRRGRAARLCALRAGAQRQAGDRRSALSRRHQAGRCSRPRSPRRSSPRRWRCSATARAPARASPRRSTRSKRSRTTACRVPTTARRCATRRRRWRWSSRPT